MGADGPTGSGPAHLRRKRVLCDTNHVPGLTGHFLRIQITGSSPSFLILRVLASPWRATELVLAPCARTLGKDK